ncbi:MAG: hypothetical protein WD767_04055 [Alphaproteobacteria bacterium]
MAVDIAGIAEQVPADPDRVAAQRDADTVFAAFPVQYLVRKYAVLSRWKAGPRCGFDPRGWRRQLDAIGFLADDIGNEQAAGG